MKTKRNLSGIYMRSQNPDTGKWDNVCFEDLPENEQDEWMNKNTERLQGMIKALAGTLNELGEQLDLYKE